MKKSTVALLLCSFGCVANTSAMADFTPSHTQDNAWMIAFGSSYAVVNSSSTSGDLATTDQTAATHNFVGNSNLTFEDGWTGNFELSRQILDPVTLGIAYEYLKTSAGPGNQISGAGATAGQWAAYLNDLSINTVLAKMRLILRHAFSIGGAAMSPYVAGGAGVARIEAYKQDVSTANGGTRNTLETNTVNKFAYSGSLGILTEISRSWSVDCGARYTNYGRFNSGVALADYAPGMMKAAVTSVIYSIGPYVNITYHFG